MRYGVPAAQDAAALLHRLTDRLMATRASAGQPREGAASGTVTAQLAGVTEEAYKAGIACLEAHDARSAEGLLSLALAACPPERVRAQEKIKTLLARCQAAGS